MKTGYKVVKVRRNGDRVSATLPSNHPMYRVYQHQGKNKLVENAMIFNNLMSAQDWGYSFGDNKINEKWCRLGDGESVEIWQVEYQKDIVKYNFVDYNDFTDSFFLSLVNKNFWTTLRKLVNLDFFDPMIKTGLENITLICYQRRNDFRVGSKVKLQKKLYKLNCLHSSTVFDHSVQGNYDKMYWEKI